LAYGAVMNLPSETMSADLVAMNLPSRSDTMPSQALMA
jgi:hypothetical protein